MLGVSRTTPNEPSKFNLAKVFNQKNAIFKDEAVFDLEYIPETLPHREDKLETLARYFQAIIYRDISCAGKVVIILGPPGSGKTVTANYFGQTLYEYCLSRSKDNPAITPLFFLHVNCRRTPSWHLIFTSILRGLIPAFPERGYSVFELLDHLTVYLNESGMRLLLCLDEIDCILTKPEDHDVLYALIRQDKNYISRRAPHHSATIMLQNQAQISLILITRNPQLLSRFDTSIRSSLALRVIPFEPYPTEQVWDILEIRAQEGLSPGTYSQEILEAITSGTNGDARRAIELLWQSGKQAEESGVLQINLENVISSKARVLPIKQETITDLSRHLKLLLSAIVSFFQENSSRTVVTTPEVRGRYEEICEEQGERPRKRTQIWAFLQRLEQLELITLNIVNKHTSTGDSRGRITHISVNLPIEKVVSLLHGSLLPDSSIYSSINSTEGV